MSSEKVKSLTNDELIAVYRDMVLIRKFEEKCASAYQQGLIIGFCHLYSGQEAVLTGLRQAMIEGDDIITSYRCHTQAVLATRDPLSIMSELFGREGGASKGKGGSMHIFAPEGNFWGGHGIVGAQVSIGTGLGFANKYTGNNNISVVLMGDGAVNQGQTYESWNMASLWSLPVLYVIENNKYAMGTSIERHSSSDHFGHDLYKRGEPMNIHCECVDGMDFFEVYNMASKLIKEIRETQRPCILQVDTYRYRGHSMSDPAKYRTKEEVQSYKDRDAIKSMAQYLVENKILKEADIENIDEEFDKQINEIYETAKARPFASLDELKTDVIIEE